MVHADPDSEFFPLQQLRQLGEVGCQAARLVPGEPASSTAAPLSIQGYAGPGFMVALYGGGARNLIEHMFESIRKRSISQLRADDTVRLN